jgi:uncharacterized protein YgiM (DUF1202 family)
MGKNNCIKKGIIIDNMVNVRKGPGTTYKILLHAHTGDIVDINSESNDHNGDLWYKVTIYNTYSGYINSKYILTFPQFLIKFIDFIKKIYY